jgi:NAD(P)-dependent dehydrogenase (short-subunit alcohol dehydrogenase family)
MGAPETPYQPYAESHKESNGPGDARPTALQVVEDCGVKLTGKTVVITGCSAGIGIETARALYEAGAKKILCTARDIPKTQKVIADIVANAKREKDESVLEAVELHLDSLDGVRKGAEIILAKTEGINILIENGVPRRCGRKCIV